jgi:hypothetical protein
MLSITRRKFAFIGAGTPRLILAIMLGIPELNVVKGIVRF